MFTRHDQLPLSEDLACSDSVIGNRVRTTRSQKKTLGSWQPFYFYFDFSTLFVYLDKSVRQSGETIDSFNSDVIHNKDMPTALCGCNIVAIIKFYLEATDKIRKRSPCQLGHSFAVKEKEKEKDQACVSKQFTTQPWCLCEGQCMWSNCPLYMFGRWWCFSMLACTQSWRLLWGELCYKFILLAGVYSLTVLFKMYFCRRKLFAFDH